ncbi:MAG: winged helix-turn-helix domain-containing protein, partial [Enterobacterales bacterium]|nr:winged helix-turn-helix domain-containing protein [Hafniaceae bacterium]MDN6090082.1 winged helix-turn-helix domain-containing protein [Enterobacterales bacterium]
HAQQNQESPLIQFSDVEVDLINRRVSRAGEDLHLTPLEFRLLTELIANAGKVLTQRQLLSTVWGPNYVEHSHYLRIYMGHLRQKLEAEPARPKHLLTETGVGYRFML